MNQIVLFPLHHKLNIWWKDRIKHQQSFTESQENQLKSYKFAKSKEQRWLVYNDGSDHDGDGGGYGGGDGIYDDGGDNGCEDGQVVAARNRN